MRLDFDQVILDIEGNPCVSKTRKEDGTIETKTLTLRSISLDALLGIFDDEKNLSGEEKAKRFKLALFISDGGGEVESEQVTLLKKLIGKAFAPMVVGRAYQLIENMCSEKPKVNGKDGKVKSAASLSPSTGP